MRLRSIRATLSTRRSWGLSINGTLLLGAVLAAGAWWIMQLGHFNAVMGNGRLNAGADETALPQVSPVTDSATATVVQGRSTPTMSVGSAGPQLPLSGRRIGLDPGHGPREDLGAVMVDPDTGKLVLAEAEFNLDVALRCRDIMVARGADVVLTRESAATLTAAWPADVNGDGTVGDEADDLQARVDIINGFHAEVFLSIHANASKPGRAMRNEIQVIYCGTSDCAFPAESKRLGKLVLAELETELAKVNYQAEGGEVVTDLDVDSSNPPLHMFVLGPVNPPRHRRSTEMPGVLSESLYISSAAQAAQLKKDSVRQAIALAYADALQAYLTTSNGQ